MSGESGSPFENTARVLRARGLDRVEAAVLARLTDAVTVKSGVVSLPEFTLKELCARTDYGLSSVQRALKRLEEKKLVVRFARPGRPYVFRPLVNQLALSLAAAAQQPRLPELQAPEAPLDDGAGAQPVRGAKGRFIPAQEISTTPVQSTGPLWKTEEPDDVALRGNPGTLYRTPRYFVPDTPVQSTGPGRRSKEVQITDQKKNESAAAGAAGLPLAGLAMTPEQRKSRSRDVSGDGNYGVLLALALHLGRTPLEARRYLAVPIASEADLREATKNAAAQSTMRYDLHGATGEGVVHAACFVAWKILCREGRFAFSALEWHDEHARRHRRDRRRTR